MEEENKEVKRASKLSSLINQETNNSSVLQVTVYYSENNWGTCEEVNLILDDTTTINQLIDSSVYKLKTELFYDNIDKKQFKVMLFKKKTKKPNYEYPACNPESIVVNYGKNHFCLVEDVNATSSDSSKKQTKEKIINNDIEIKNDKIEILNHNDERDYKNQKNNKICGDRCFICYIF